MYERINKSDSQLGSSVITLAFEDMRVLEEMLAGGYKPMGDYTRRMPEVSDHVVEYKTKLERNGIDAMFCVVSINASMLHWCECAGVDLKALQRKAKNDFPKVFRVYRGKHI
jgi:hypothetical protein